jgi:hypothetical protein
MPVIMPVNLPINTPADAAFNVPLAAERRDLEVWRSFVQGRGRAPRDLANRFDALIAHRDRRHAAGMLLSSGWRREALGGGFELWVKGSEVQSNANREAAP